MWYYNPAHQQSQGFLQFEKTNSKFRVQFIRLQIKDQHPAGGRVSTVEAAAALQYRQISPVSLRVDMPLIALELIDDEGQMVILDSPGL